MIMRAVFCALQLLAIVSPLFGLNPEHNYGEVKWIHIYNINSFIIK
jgi:hypothetical protein